MKKGKPGASFERLVAAVHQKLDNRSSVAWNEFIHKCQIDVAIRGEFAGTQLLVIVECKDHKARIGIDHIRKQVSVRNETKANKVIIVARSGYTKPALELAEKECIDTCVLRPVRSSDNALQSMSASISVTQRDLYEIEGQFSDGSWRHVGQMNQLEEHGGGRVFVDLLIKSWLKSDNRRCEEDSLICLSLNPPPTLLMDEESSPIHALRFKYRVYRGVSSATVLWKAPAQWVFVKQTPNSKIDETTFFGFQDLETIADSLKR